jgi:hypothetical protein
VSVAEHGVDGIAERAFVTEPHHRVGTTEWAQQRRVGMKRCGRQKGKGTFVVYVSKKR